MSFQKCIPSDGEMHIIRSARFPLACLILSDNPGPKNQPGVVVADCSKIAKPNAWIFNKTAQPENWTTQFIKNGNFLASSISSGIVGVGWPDNTVHHVWKITPVQIYETFGCGIIAVNTSTSDGRVISGKNSLTLSTPTTLTYDTYTGKSNQEWVLEKWDDIINLNY